MEFKRRLVKKKKAAQDKRHKEDGWKRIKVRGRKRWVKPAEKKSA